MRSFVLHRYQSQQPVRAGPSLEVEEARHFSLGVVCTITLRVEKQKIYFIRRPHILNGNSVSGKRETSLQSGNLNNAPLLRHRWKGWQRKTFLDTGAQIPHVRRFWLAALPVSNCSLTCPDKTCLSWLSWLTQSQKGKTPAMFLDELILLHSECLKRFF